MEKNNLKIKKYPSKSAGSLLVDDIPIVHENLQVKDIEKILTNKKNKFSTINYIYIINSKNILTKVVSIKELFRSPKNILAKNLNKLKIVFVSPYTDKEKVSMLALKHSLKAVPVINKKKEFLGVVSSDTILQILYDESTENLFKLSGVTFSAPYQNKIFFLPLYTSLKHRLPWLIFGLLGGLLMAGVVSYFENFLTKNIILATFIPLIIYV
jgi:magnesium transporter